jgi:hypothetical protein
MSMSVDGFITGTDDGMDHGLGVNGERLCEQGIADATPVDLADIARHVTAESRGAAQAAGVNLRTDLGPASQGRLPTEGGGVASLRRRDGGRHSGQVALELVA